MLETAKRLVAQRNARIADIYRLAREAVGQGYVNIAGIRRNAEVSAAQLDTYMAAAQWSVVQGIAAPRAAVPVNKCTVCFHSVKDDYITRGKKIKCKEGHHIHQDCLAFHVRNEHLETISRGLPCCGGPTPCTQTFSLDRVRKILSNAARAELDTRIRKAAAPGNVHPDQTAVEKFASGLEESFCLFCPGCPQSLSATIDGYNAARCQHCAARFCYLCLEHQVDNKTDLLHQHVREHSNNYWEPRPGYEDRYHWLLYRANLSRVFETDHVGHGVGDAEKMEILESRKDFLKERNMWPMPAGLATSEWIKKVQDTPDIELKTKIELLQNEYIYRYKMKDQTSVDLIGAELKQLKAPILTTLDVPKDERV